MKLYRINALMLKYFYTSINRLDRIFDIVYWPLIDLFLWGFASLYLESISKSSLLTMFIGGVILWVFLWRATQDIAIFVLEDFWSKNLYNLFTSPVKSSELIISTIIFSIFRGIITFFVLTSLAFLMYKLNLFSVGILNIGIFAFLLMFFGSILGIFVTSFIFIFGTRIQVFSWSIPWLIYPFSCVFYPLSSLPKWAYNIAVFMPTTYIFEGLRQLINNQPLNYMNLVYSFILSVFFLILVLIFFNYAFNKAKKIGRFTSFE